MSENARPAANNVVIALIVVVLVLAVGLGYMVWKNNNSVPAVSDVSVGSNTGANTGTTATSTPAAAAAGTAIVPADFDAKAATKVSSGTTPEKWVDEYYAAADKGDWTTAFDHLPAAKQTGSSPEELQKQVAGYGVTGYKITSSAAQGDEATVIVDQQTSQYGTFENTWVFKKQGDTWLVAGKKVTGMK